MQSLRVIRCVLRFLVNAAWLGAIASTALANPPSQPGVDAPELAALGSFAVGVRTLTLIEHDAIDVLSLNPDTGLPTTHDRTLLVDLWYPATNTVGANPLTYHATFPTEVPNQSIEFSATGLAITNAKPLLGPHPLVVVSHGYSNATVALSWLTENLASKGYVVAAIRHEDPPITDRAQTVGPMLRRPLDIVFVTSSLQASLAKEGLIDASRVGLVGYSMGGYGVLAAGGATLDPQAPAVKRVPNGALAVYAKGGAKRDVLSIQGLKGIVALAPAGGGKEPAWGNTGLQDIRVPLFLIAGNRDHTVDYATGAQQFFEDAIHAPRYLLTYRNGGHHIALDPAPETMKKRLWDIDWFEDPVWRNERVLAINLHMITAFFDTYLKGESAKHAYLDVRVTDSNMGTWPAPGPKDYADYSPNTGDITVWKGFQRNYAEGLELLSRPAASH